MVPVEGEGPAPAAGAFRYSAGNADAGSIRLAGRVGRGQASHLSSEDGVEAVRDEDAFGPAREASELAFSRRATTSAASSPKRSFSCLLSTHGEREGETGLDAGLNVANEPELVRMPV